VRSTTVSLAPLPRRKTNQARKLEIQTSCATMNEPPLQYASITYLNKLEMGCSRETFTYVKSHHEQNSFAGDSHTYALRRIPSTTIRKLQQHGSRNPKGGKRIGLMREKKERPCVSLLLHSQRIKLVKTGQKVNFGKKFGQYCKNGKKGGAKLKIRQKLSC